MTNELPLQAQHNFDLAFDAAGGAWRDAAVEQAVQAAGPDWCEQAYTVFCAHALEFASFSTCQVRAAATRAGLATREPRAWGAVAMRAARAGVVRHGGYVASSSPLGHLAPVSLWHSAIVAGTGLPSARASVL